MFNRFRRNTSGYRTVEADGHDHRSESGGGKTSIVDYHHRRPENAYDNHCAQ